MLDAYLDRVGLALPGLSTLAALREMLATHVATLPFGNLDMLFGRGISPWASARHEHCAPGSAASCLDVIRAHFRWQDDRRNGKGLVERHPFPLTR